MGKLRKFVPCSKVLDMEFVWNLTFSINQQGIKLSGPLDLGSFNNFNGIQLNGCGKGRGICLLTNSLITQKKRVSNSGYKTFETHEDGCNLIVLTNRRSTQVQT